MSRIAVREGEMTTTSTQAPLYNQIQCGMILGVNRDIIRAIADGQLKLTWKRRSGRLGLMLDPDDINKIGAILDKEPNWDAVGDPERTGR